MFIRVYLKEQLPVHCALRQGCRTGIVHIGHAMRDELALQAHIILNSVRVPQQSMVNSGVVGWTGKRRDQRLELVRLNVWPVADWFLKLWLLGDGGLASDDHC